MTLDEFLVELTSRRALHRKVGLVARYWRQVQSLPTNKQQQVALALGSKAAWSRLEKLFAKDGALSDGELAVKRALDRVAEADPDELRDLASKVRAGDYADVSRELVEVVGLALDEEAASDGNGAAGGGAATGEEAGPPGTTGTAREAAEDREAAPREVTPDEAPELPDGPAEDAPHAAGKPVAVAAAASSPSRAEFTAEPSQKTNDSTPLPEVAAERVPATPPEVAAEPAPPRVTTRPATREDATPPAPPKVATEPVPRLQDSAAPDKALASKLSATEKLGLLRALRADPGYGARLGRSGRSQLITRVGPGWAARRALSELIRAGAIEDLDEALQLTERLPSDVQKTWCLGDLVEHWSLGESELERVLRTVRSPAATNRLRRRHARRADRPGAR